MFWRGDRKGLFSGFAGNHRRQEVTRKQRDSARLGKLHQTHECAAAWESRVFVVCADKVPAGFVCNGLRDLRGGHPGFSESVNGFHVADRNTLQR